MKTIYKFPLDLGKRNNLSLPDLAKFLKFDAQGSDGLMVWYELEVQSYRSPRTLRVFTTGEEVPTDAKHLGTCLVGSFVWHLYEVL